MFNIVLILDLLTNNVLEWNLHEEFDWNREINLFRFEIQLHQLLIKMLL